MDRIRPENLEELLQEREGPCVSMYMPTHRTWSETRQDPIRLKNLLGDAKKQLLARGLRSSEAVSLLEPVRKLADEESFWRNQGDGLALFVSPGVFLSYRLPLPFDELVAVTDRFHIKPLLQLFAGDGHFYVLSLNLENVRLLAGTRHELKEMDVNGVPLRLSEATRFDEFERQHQFHSGTAPAAGGTRAAVFHGHGSAADDANVKKRIVEFFRQVDNGVRGALAEEQTPLVLAGQDHLRGLYRTVNHYEYLADERVDVNPDGLSSDELHQRVWALLEPRFRQAREDAATAFDRLISKEPDRASDRLDEIVPAAHFRRIKVLFVRSDRHEWGRFDPTSQQVEVHEDIHAGDLDLLDFAAAQTLRYAGAVYLEGGETIPGGAKAAAIFRY